jgi:hypothetical protein
VKEKDIRNIICLSRHLPFFTGYDKPIICELQANTLTNCELVGRSDIMSVDFRSHGFCVFTSPLWEHDNDYCMLSAFLIVARLQ